MRLCNFIVRGYLFSHLCASGTIQSMHTQVGPDPILSNLVSYTCANHFHLTPEQAPLSPDNW